MRDPRGATGRSLARRESTRAGILRGARACFRDLGYAATAVEDILQAAGVSRATFYAHFENKHAVLTTVIAEVEPHILALYDDLGPLAEATSEHLRGWLGHLLDFFTQHLDVLQIWGDAINDRDFTRSLQGLGREMASRLGLALPVPEGEGRPEDRERVMLSVFFLSQVGQFCSLTLGSGWNVDRDIAAATMAQMLHRSIVIRLNEIDGAPATS